MEKFQAVFEQFLERFMYLSFAQKVTMGTIVVALCGISYFVLQHASDDYDVLYSNMNLADASAIVAKLKENKQPFKLADGGTTILVPAGQKNSLVLDTVAELQGEEAVSLTQIPPVVSGDVQREWIKKLNTNAIISILKGIRGIKNAQVIISQPEKSLFLENEEDTRASVMLMVEPGFRLRDEQIKTIKALVSHSVPGLEPQNVAIADNAGNSLEGPGSMGAVVSSADLRKRNYEDETSKKLVRLLAPVVGKDNVVVSVSADFNLDQTQSKIHRVIPTGGDDVTPVGVAVSTQTQTEKYSGAKKEGPGGTAGAESNLPSYQSESGGDDADGKNGKDYEFGKSTTNYEISKEDKIIHYAPGQVERMSVAVVLNKVLTAQETAEIRDLVSNAAGLDFARGDSIDIKGFQFTELMSEKQEALAAAAKEAEMQAFWLQLATVITVSVIILVALIMFYNLVKAPASKGQIIHVPQHVEPEPIQYIEPEPIEDKPMKAPVAILEANLDPEIEMMRDAINDAIETDPKESARLLMAYMKDY